MRIFDDSYFQSLKDVAKWLLSQQARIVLAHISLIHAYERPVLSKVMLI